MSSHSFIACSSWGTHTTEHPAGNSITASDGVTIVTIVQDNVEDVKDIKTSHNRCRS